MSNECWRKYPCMQAAGSINSGAGPGVPPYHAPAIQSPDQPFYQPYLSFIAIRACCIIVPEIHTTQCGEPTTPSLRGSCPLALALSPPGLFLTVVIMCRTACSSPRATANSRYAPLSTLPMQQLRRRAVHPPLCAMSTASHCPFSKLALPLTP